MTDSITPSNTREFASKLATAKITHDFQRTIEIQTDNPPAGSCYQQGCRFHALVAKRRGARLTVEQTKMLPWLKASEDLLIELGVSDMAPEVTLQSDNMPPGRLDLLLSGGLAARGCAEFKVVSTLPHEPVPEHLLQSSGYATLVADEFNDRRVWLILIYISFHEGLRAFVHKGSHRLQAAARELLAA